MGARRPPLGAREERRRACAAAVVFRLLCAGSLAAPLPCSRAAFFSSLSRPWLRPCRCHSLPRLIGPISLPDSAPTLLVSQQGTADFISVTSLILPEFTAAAIAMATAYTARKPCAKVFGGCRCSGCAAGGGPLDLDRSGTRAARVRRREAEERVYSRAVGSSWDRTALYAGDPLLCSLTCETRAAEGAASRGALSAWLRLGVLN